MGLTLGTKYGMDVAKPSPQPQELGGRYVILQVTFDNSYVTGGEALTASDLGFDEILCVIPVQASGYTFEYDKANAKLKAYYYDYDAVADGAGIEVANAADLSAVTCWLLAFGV